jgi:hypothetical protein
MNNIKESKWPFDQERNVAAITTRQIIELKYPILTVVHYDDDDSWAFLCGTTTKTEDGRVISMQEALTIDGTLKGIANLKPGWYATRAFVGDVWFIFESEDY